MLFRSNVAMGVYDLYAFLDIHNPLTLDELWDALISTAPNLDAKLRYADIFQLNHVSPQIEGARMIGSPNAFTTNLTVAKSDLSPVFSWKIPLDSDNSGQLLNRFGVMFFDDTDTMVYDTQILTIGLGDGEMQVTGNTVKYIPRLNDWRSNITSRVGTSSRSFRWVVYGGFFGDETLQGDITTGNYWSSAGVIVVVP